MPLSFLEQLRLLPELGLARAVARSESNFLSGFILEKKKLFKILRFFFEAVFLMLDLFGLVFFLFECGCVGCPVSERDDAADANFFHNGSYKFTQHSWLLR